MYDTQLFLSMHAGGDQVVSGTVTPPAYGADMDESGAFSGQGASSFSAGVAAAVGGLRWETMPAGLRVEWLSALSDAEGAISASRAAALSAGADSLGAAERAAELVRATGMSGSEAAAHVKVADTLDGAPEVAEALATGAITTGHVDVLVRGLAATDRRDAVADPAVLAAATGSGVDAFRADMRAWKAHHHGDLDGTRLAARQHANRRASVTTAVDGMVHLRADLAPDVGSVVAGAIRAEAERLWREEGEGASDPADALAGRSALQRNADALANIFRSGGVGSSPGRPGVDLVVVVDHGMLADRVVSTGRCESSDGTPLTAAAARRLACEAGVIPAVMGGHCRVLDLGRRSRTVTPAQRTALTVRDGGCVFPGCDRPPSWCDTHHVIHWLDLGPSDLWNLVLLCSAHHVAVHEGGWRLEHLDESDLESGRLVFTDPYGRSQRPDPPAAGRRRSGSGPVGDAEWPGPTVLQDLTRGGGGHGGDVAYRKGDRASRGGHAGVEVPGLGGSAGGGGNSELEVRGLGVSASGGGSAGVEVHEQGQLLPARKRVVQRR